MYKKTVAFYLEYTTAPSSNTTKLIGKVVDSPTLKTKKVTNGNTTTTYTSWLYKGSFTQPLFNLIKDTVDNGTAKNYCIMLVEKNCRYVFKYGSLATAFNPLVTLRGTTSISY